MGLDCMGLIPVSMGWNMSIRDLSIPTFRTFGAVLTLVVVHLIHEPVLCG